MKKQNIYVSIAIIVLAILIGIYLGHRTVTPPGTAATAAAGDSADSGDKTFALSCDAGKSLSITFHLPADKEADVTTSDGRTMTLANTSSSSGASYTSTDGNTVLSLDGSTLMLTESGTPTFTNCTLASDSGDASVGAPDSTGSTVGQ